MLLKIGLMFGMVCANSDADVNKTLGSDAFKSMEEIVNGQGYRIEEHQVVTEDGYILGIWRIPGSLTYQNDANEEKPPVLFGHGLEGDMMTWVIQLPEFKPALVLARQGYDVWMCNNRGSRFSLAHTTLDPKSFEYWQFSWEEMGTKDTPAVIDYILSQTGKSQLSYIGHSEGTTQIMAGAALIPDFYKEKLNLAILLAPPAS